MKGLEFFRKLRGMTMKELADNIGVSRQYIDRMEKDRNRIPISRLKQLSDFFGVNESILDRDLSVDERRRIMDSVLKEGFFGVDIDKVNILK